MESDEAGAPDQSGAKMESAQPTDDFKRIQGIGRAAELRLHQAGVQSYAELAALPEAEIAEKARTALPEVAEQNWRGQAADLAGLSSAVTSERSETSGRDNQHYEVFTVEFLLNDDNEVKRTRVVHVRSSQEAKWPGWAAKELLDFMTERGAPPVRPEAGAAGTPVVHEPMGRSAGTRATAPRPRVRKLEALPLGTGKPTWLLPANQPFSVRVSLDVPERGVVGEQAAEYVVSVAARPVGEGPRQAIGEVHGRLDAPADLRVQSPGLRPGLYRLEGAVELGTTPRELLKFLPPIEDGVIDVS